MIVSNVLLGAGMSLLDPLKLAPSESLLPKGTSHPGPPDYVNIYKLRLNKPNQIKVHLPYNLANFDRYCTKTVESLAARARMSAQDTVCGHSLSKAHLISSITSNPLAEFMFGFDPFSLTMVSVLSNNIEASHPCKQDVSI